MYVENLIGPNTVNTIPPKTLEAFLDHGTVALTLESDLDEARAQLHDLEALGIDIDEVTQELLDEGVNNFVKPYDELIRTINEKKEALINAWHSQKNTADRENVWWKQPHLSWCAVPGKSPLQIIFDKKGTQENDGPQ